jgi:hypothetical protein
MQFEEPGLAAFVAGTAIGYLIWYWSRNGGEEGRQPEPAIPMDAGRATGEPMPPKRRFQAVPVLACAFLLVVIFIAMAFERAHPMGPPRLVTFNHWTIAFAILALIAILGMLLRSSVRKHEASGAYTGVFKSVLLLVSGFVLAVFVAILFGGPPGSIYPSMAERWIGMLPLGSMLLGILFGSIGAEWLNYMMHKDGLRTVAAEVQHRRWGFVLLTLLLLGVVYPLVPQLVGKISSANLATPLGGFTLTAQPVSTIRQLEGPSRIGNETSEVRIWEGLQDLGDMADRDRTYATIFYGTTAGNKLKAIEKLHDGANDFAKNVLAPLGKCVNKYFETFNNRGLIQRRFNDAILTYTKLLHLPKGDRVDAKALLVQLAAAANALNEDMRSDPKVAESEEPCEKAAKSISDANPSLVSTLPYAAMGLSFLLFDSGETEQAMREIASWVEDHYAPRTVEARLAECNKKVNDSCAYYGYKAEIPQQGETAKWEKLPAWYRIRIEFELTEMLALTVNYRVSYLASHALVHTIESLFSESQIGGPYEWAKCGSAESNERPKAGTRNELLESRMVAAYLSLVDKMLRNLTYVANEGLLDDDVAISPEMLKYAKRNSEVELHCLSYYHERASDRETYEGEYKATYGVLLTQAIMQRARSAPRSEIESAARRNDVRDARDALRYARAILSQRSAEHDRELSGKRLNEKLFALIEERDYLRRAEAALRSLDSLER